MASPFDDGWLLSEPLELIRVEVQMNHPDRVVLAERVHTPPAPPFDRIKIVTNPRGLNGPLRRRCAVCGLPSELAYCADCSS